MGQLKIKCHDGQKRKQGQKFLKENRQFIGSRERAEHVANKFLLGNLETMGERAGNKLC